MKNWFFQKQILKSGGPEAENALGIALVFFILYVFYGVFHLSVLTDWVGFAVDEGFTTYGAQRVREGKRPFVDFFFLWTPGILWAHALLQELGASAAGERFLSLVASGATGALILRRGFLLGIGKEGRVFLAILLFLWGFTLWNIPYSSWIALFFVMVATEALDKSRWLLAALLFSVSFWFKQNIGILSVSGAVVYLIMHRDLPQSLKVVAGFICGLFFPFLIMFYLWGQGGLEKVLYQIFLFPLKYASLMKEPLPRELIAKPLLLSGAWILSLYFFRANQRIKSLVLCTVVALLFWGLMQQGRNFFLGYFMVFSLLVWIGGFVLAVQEPAKIRSQILLFFLPGLGAFLQVYPRSDFQHFLFVFPLPALLFFWMASRMREKFVWIPRVWIYLPSMILILGGMVSQLRVNLFHFYGFQDPVGFVSFGDGHRLNQEMEQVRSYLEANGLKKGDPILVMPNATSFYRFSGFSNPTPHDQFFPGYVEAFGAKQEEVLEGYGRAGGDFIVVQQRSKIELFTPILEQKLREGYSVVKEFPVHFSVWKKK